MTHVICAPSRQITGALAVVAIHAGLILALTSGLTAHIAPQTRSITEVVVVPPAKPAPQVHPVKRPDAFATVAPDVPLPTPVIEIEMPPLVRDVPELATVPTGPGDLVSREPLPLRVDPRHPLTPPEYPATSVRLNEEGRVLLLIHVLPDGRVGDVRISRSSGYPRLDAAALREARRSWRFQPAEASGGQAIAAWGTFEVVFTLD